MMNDLLNYDISPDVRAFTSTRGSELPYNVICGHQVHGDRIAVIDRPDLTRADLEGYDAFITDLKGCAIGVRTADCIPVLLYDPVNGAAAAIHSGWKGTVLKISGKTIARMAEAFGTKAENLLAVIGPGIQKHNFQVGEEVVEKFREAGFPVEGDAAVASWDGPKIEGTMRGGWHIDLIEAVRRTLTDAGVQAGNISASDICTYDDGRLFSARREGTECGRNINSIMILRVS